MGDFSHFNEEGRAKMVHVGEKDATERKAVAREESESMKRPSI